MSTQHSNKPKEKSQTKNFDNELKKAKKKNNSATKSAAPTAPSDVELPASSYKVIRIPPESIKVDIANRCRPVVPTIVNTLVDSIRKDGLRTPLTVRWPDLGRSSLRSRT
jgi:hypothetical protein